MRKKLLIIGASILQLPAILKAKKMGLEVAVADYNSNAIGIKYADHYFNASTIDIQAICDVALEYKPDGIMTLATDMPMRSIAAAAHKMGLVSISMDTAVKATDKGEMIKAFKANNVASPWFFIIGNESDLQRNFDKITYPCILKPTDNAGSRGVVLVNCPEELQEAYKYSCEQSRSGNVILEEFLQGNEVSVEIMVYNGDVHVLAITDKLTTGAPHFVETGHSQPSNLRHKDLVKISELAISAVKAVGINNGPAHVEIMNTNNGPKMIELGARLGGDCITSHLVPLSTGVNMIEATIRICLGEKPDLEPLFQRGSAIRFLQSQTGYIKNITGIEDVKCMAGIEEVFISKQIGDYVTTIHSSIDRLGYVIASANSNQEAIDKCNEAIAKIDIEVQNN